MAKGKKHSCGWAGFLLEGRRTYHRLGEVSVRRGHHSECEGCRIWIRHQVMPLGLGLGVGIEVISKFRIAVAVIFFSLSMESGKTTEWRRSHFHLTT